jgi:hypothetical protein
MIGPTHIPLIEVSALAFQLNGPQTVVSGFPRSKNLVAYRFVELKYQSWHISRTPGSCGVWSAGTKISCDGANSYS